MAMADDGAAMEEGADDGGIVPQEIGDGEADYDLAFISSPDRRSTACAVLRSRNTLEGAGGVAEVLPPRRALVDMRCSEKTRANATRTAAWPRCWMSSTS